jgi:uncharacterized protein (DUF433 family)
MELNNIIEREGGSAVFAGTSVPLRSLFEFLQDDQTLETFLNNFPSITRYHAVAVLTASLEVLAGDEPDPNSDESQSAPIKDLATAPPNLVCKYCKDPIYAVRGTGYLHAYSGSLECIGPQLGSFHTRASPYDDKETYPAYRARLITEMTKNMQSYSDVDSPHELLEIILSDARHFAEANHLNFDDHNRRSRQIYLDNNRGTQR